MNQMAKSAPSMTSVAAEATSPLTETPKSQIVGIPEEVWEYFGVNNLSDRRDSKVNDRVKTIIGHILQENPNALPGDLIFEISRMDRKLGHPAIGQERYDNMYRYITIQREIKSLQKKASAYERSI